MAYSLPKLLHNFHAVNEEGNTHNLKKRKENKETNGFNR